MSEEKLSTHVKTIPCKIIAVEQGWDVAKPHWRALSETVQRMYNDAMLHWLALHVQRGNDMAVRGWMTDYIESHNGRGKKPKCEVQCWPKDIRQAIEKMLLERHPANSRVRTLVMNMLTTTMPKLRATKSNFKRWQRVLGGYGEFENVAHPMPIPFDRQNGGLIQDAGGWQFWFRLDRQINEKGKAMSEKYLATIKTRGRNNASLLRIIQRIHEGEYKFCGSNLLQRDGLWFVELCYRMPLPVCEVLDESRVAYLKPAVTRPVDLLIDEKPEGLRRRGKGLAWILKSLFRQLRSRQAFFKVAGSARKGHGRNKATEGWVQKLRRRRRHVCKTYNQQLASDVVNRCASTDCGTLVYYQPTEARRSRCFLTRAAAVDEYRGGEGWDWYELGNLLERRCKERQITFNWRKLGERKGKKPRAKSAEAGQGEEVTEQQVLSS